VKLATVLAAVLLTSAPAFAQAPPPDTPQAPPSPVFRSGSALVALNVSVQDAGAKYVGGLRPDDFAVYEDGVKQDVRFFESSAVPLDLVVLIDASSSMSDKIQIVREAAAGFLNTLRPGDRGAVVSFANSVSIVQPLTTDRALLDRAVHGIAAYGATALNNAVYISLRTPTRAARPSSCSPTARTRRASSASTTC
jgi:VWFA-related protein